MAADLNSDFHRAMLGLYDSAGELKPPYRSKAFISMLSEYGGKATADRLLASSKPALGFTELILRTGHKDNLRLSVEYLVLQNPWKTLFTEGQLAIARKRLTQVNCPLPEHATAGSIAD